MTSDRSVLKSEIDTRYTVLFRKEPNRIAILSRTDSFVREVLVDLVTGETVSNSFGGTYLVSSPEDADQWFSHLYNLLVRQGYTYEKTTHGYWNP